MGHKIENDQRHKNPGAASPKGMEALKALRLSLLPSVDPGYYWAKLYGMEDKEIVKVYISLSHYHVNRMGDERIYPVGDFMFLEKIEGR